MIFPARRHSLGLIRAALAALFALSAAAAVAQHRMRDGQVAQAELLNHGGVEDIVIGDPKAPVTVIEYASLSCPHCANFHKNSLPRLKSEFIDAGKVRFIFRDFPFDGVGLAGAMLARCTGPEKFHDVIETLFLEQQQWAFSNDPEAALIALSKRYGFTQETFGACLQNQKIYDGVLAGRQRAHEIFGVDSTPTIFINGARYRGALPPDDLAAAVKEALPAGMK
jgi:protein-disulfide isomerase